MAIATSTALTVASVAATAASTAGSFIQANKQKKLQQKAESEAKRAMDQARGKLDVNFYDALSVDLTPYELEREALLSQGAQLQQAAVEGEERGAAASAGKILASQQKAQQDITKRMSKELSDLEKMSAKEDSRLRDVGVQIDLEEAAGAQQAAADAQKARAAAIQQGFEGLTSLASQGLEAAPLFGKGGADATPDAINVTGTGSGNNNQIEDAVDGWGD